MKHINRIKHIGSAGFSLVEILVVLFFIGVIGVIAVIAIPNIGKKAPDKPITDGTVPALTEIKPGGSTTVALTETDYLAKSFVTAWNTAVDQKIVDVDGQKHTGVTEKLLSVTENPTKFGINSKIASDLHYNSATIFKLVENDVATGKLSLTKFEKDSASSSTTGATKVGT